MTGDWRDRWDEAADAESARRDRLPVAALLDDVAHAAALLRVLKCAELEPVALAARNPLLDANLERLRAIVEGAAGARADDVSQNTRRASAAAFAMRLAPRR